MRRRYGWLGVAFLVLAVARFLLGSGVLWRLGDVGGWR